VCAIFSVTEKVYAAHSILYERTHVTDVVSHKYVSQCRFSKCGVCAELKKHIRESKSYAENRVRNAALQSHRQDVEIERMHVYSVWAACITPNSDRCSLMIDGADSNGMDQPCKPGRDKSWEGVQRLATSLTGSVIKGPNGFHAVRAWSWHDVYSKGVNPTAAAVLASLRALPQPLPRRLHIQFDNCWADNKCTYVFAFFAYLVHHGIFE
jgi:hypothetical protein